MRRTRALPVSRLRQPLRSAILKKPESRTKRAIPLPFLHVGEWLSLVEHLVRDQGVGGSNPLSPTKSSKRTLQFFLLQTIRLLRGVADLESADELARQRENQRCKNNRAKDRRERAYRFADDREECH